MGGFLFKIFIGSRAPRSNESVEHRAETNEERGRISIANFYNASVDAEVAPTTKLVDEHNPCLYMKFIKKRLHSLSPLQATEREATACRLFQT